MEYCNGAVPPLAVTVIVPSLTPQALASVDSSESIVGRGFTVILTSEVSPQLALSAIKLMVNVPAVPNVLDVLVVVAQPIPYSH